MTAMAESLREVAAWLHTTAPSEWIRHWRWIWPICEILHFFGLSVLIGVVGMLDLRLLGFLRRIPLQALRAMLPYGLAGFFINLVTGVIFFVGAPEQYVMNLAFGMKLLFLGAAALNLLYFETAQSRRVTRIAPNGDGPLAFKLAGAISLFCWLMVLYWGRMMSFVGNTY